MSGGWWGIDFSSDVRQWREGAKRTNVWLALVRGKPPRLAEVLPVQQLPGSGAPFERLAQLLKAARFRAAAIDAPFSLPDMPLPYRRFLRHVALWPRGSRPFPDARAVLAFVGLSNSGRGVKRYRQTEWFWLHRGVMCRSTLWAGPRGGAGLVAACAYLLALCRRPVWPWASRDNPALLVEAFPAAQLRAWNLPHQKYSGYDSLARKNRARIVAALEERMDLGPWRSALLAQPDALDATLAAWAAIAVTEDRLHNTPSPEVALSEGWIAVHR